MSEVPGQKQTCHWGGCCHSPGEKEEVRELQGFRFGQQEEGRCHGLTQGPLTKYRCPQMWGFEAEAQRKTWTEVVNLGVTS